MDQLSKDNAAQQGEVDEKKEELDKIKKENKSAKQ